MFHRIIKTRADGAITILRLVLGIVFLAHGLQTVLGLFDGPGFSQTLEMFAMMGIPTVLGGPHAKSGLSLTGKSFEYPRKRQDGCAVITSKNKTRRFQ